MREGDDESTQSGHPGAGVPGTPLGVFMAGFRLAASVPGLILLASCVGFGALARDAGMGPGHAILMMGTFFALPAQVVLLDNLARGASILGGALAVTLTGVRLLPMTVSLVPYLREAKGSRLGLLLAAHAIAVTAWIEGMRRLPHMPEALRLPHFLGIGLGMISVSLLGTAIGFYVAGSVPAAISAVLLFLTPLYFLLSLLATAQRRSDRLAIIAGAILGPPFYLLAPGFDLLLAGLIGGSIVHFGTRRLRV